MRKIISLALLVVIFTACSKGNEDVKTITNLSGFTWYETWVWFADSEDTGSELKGFDDSKKTVEVGKSINVETESKYFYITCKDSKGKNRMSKRKPFSGEKATVTESDLY